MGALAFWKAVVDDRSSFLERVIGLLAERGIRYCVIGGVGVNAYSEPIVTQYLDLVVALDQVETAGELMRRHFVVRAFEHSLNVYDPDSKLQVQVQLDEGIDEILPRAEVKEVLGLRLPVAAPRDLIRLKIAAAREQRRRPSKRGKDLLDVARLVTAFPALPAEVPGDIRARVEELIDPE